MTIGLAVLTLHECDGQTDGQTVLAMANTALA